VDTRRHANSMISSILSSIFPPRAGSVEGTAEDPDGQAEAGEVMAESPSRRKIRAANAPVKTGTIRNPPHPPRHRVVQ